VCPSFAVAQVPGDCVRLDGAHQNGMSVHPAGRRQRLNPLGEWDGRDGAGDRWPTGCIQIESATKRGCATRSYLTVIPPDPDPDPAGPELLTYGIASFDSRGQGGRRLRRWSWIPRRPVTDQE
jgi:hypothetical protein